MRRITSTQQWLNLYRLFVPQMNHQPFQHTSPIQWSAIPEHHLQQPSQTSQIYPPSPHHIAPHRFSSSATSPPLPQVSCSMMHLQSSTRPQSPHTIRPSTLQHHTQCTQNTHRSLEPPASDSDIPTNHPWQMSRRGNAYISQQRRLHEDTRPHSTLRINSKNFRISPTMTSQYLLLTLPQQQAANQPHSCVYINRPQYMYTVSQIIVTW